MLGIKCIEFLIFIQLLTVNKDYNIDLLNKSTQKSRYRFYSTQIVYQQLVSINFYFIKTLNNWYNCAIINERCYLITDFIKIVEMDRKLFLNIYYHFLQFFKARYLQILNNNNFCIKIKNMQIKAEKLDIYLKQMAHYDPDNMQMAARAVSELVISGKLILQNDLQTANTIRQAFIKQMQSDNYNIHAHAIKCVAEMISKFPHSQVQSIFQKTIKSISDPHLDDKKRQIYGVCAGTMIHQASEDFGATLKHLFVDSIKALLQTKEQKPQIQIMLINVITQFIKKWPSVAGSTTTIFDRKKLIFYLLKNIQNRGNYELIRKSQSALGRLAVILSFQHLQILLKDQTVGLVNFLKYNLSKSDNGGRHDLTKLKNVREAVTCLSYIMKTHNSDLRNWAQQIAQIFINVIKIYSVSPDIDQIDLLCDIIQGSIICLSYILKSFPRELNKLLVDPSKPLSNFVQQLINFDAQAMMTLVGDQSQPSEYEAEDQYEYYGEDNQMQQKSWKVRRAVVHYLTVLIRKDKQFRQTTGKSQKFIESLGSKLIQQNSQVNETALQAFGSLIQSLVSQKIHTATEEMQQSMTATIKASDIQFAKAILLQVQRKSIIIFSSTKFSDQVKIEIVKLLLRLITLFKNELPKQPEIVEKIMKQAESELLKTNIVQNKYMLLLVLKQLVFKQLTFSQYKKIVEIQLKITSDKNFKTASAAYKVIKRILQSFPKEMVEWDQFTQVLKNICEKLKQHDTDRLIKKSVIGCLGVLFDKYFDVLNEFTQIKCLEALELKLKIQIQKRDILSQIGKINNKYKAKPSQIDLLIQILKKIIENLGTTNFDVNFQAVQATKRVVEILQNNLDKTTVKDILEKTKPLFKQNNLPPYIDILMEKYPGEFKNYIQPILKSAGSETISNMIRLNIVDTKTCINLLRNFAQPQNAKKISQILGTIGLTDSQLVKQINQSLWGQICLGALGYIGKQSNSGFLLKHIKQSKNQQTKFQAARALGNIGSRDPIKILPLLMNQAEKKQDCYIFLFAIRQLLFFATQPVNNLEELTKWLEQKSNGHYEGQSVYYAIAQCFGKIFVLNESILEIFIKKIDKLPNGTKIAFANSLRFAIQAKPSQNLISQNMQKYFSQVINLTDDSDVDIRYAAMKSLSSVVITHIDIIKSFIDEKFWVVLKKNLEIHEELIIEVDYGISKQKKDTGKPLRLEAFNFLKAILNKLSIEGHIHQLMQLCLNKINKQTSTDLVLKRLNILKSLCEKDFTQFISLQANFVKIFSIDDGILKAYKVEKETDDERIQVYLRGIFKQILQIASIAEKEDSDQIRGFLSTVKSTPRFNQIIDILNN